jgi:hypothetical protein
MDEVATTNERRHSRFWLYTPFVLLLLVAVAWSIAWWVIRNRATESLDAWLGSEARAGRQWACADRQVGGYPFRIQVACGSLTLKQGPVTASLGRVTSISQVYQPAFVITEIEGPLRVSDGRATLEGTWDLLQSSLHATPRGLQRFSLVAESPRVTVTGLGPDAVVSNSRHLELHVRPDPSRVADKAYDAALSVKEAQIPVLDHLVGGAEPADFSLDATVTQAEGFKARPMDRELERWRQAGGTLEVVMLSIAKGMRRAEAKGEITLDEFHRPVGQLNASAAGLDGLLGNVVGGRLGGALLGALFGQAPNGGTPVSQPTLVALPPLRLENGKLAMGPFVIPGIRFAPLY